MVAASARVRTSLVAEVERRSNGTPVLFQHTPVTDSAELFRRRGYDILDAGWYVLMAAELGQAWSSRAAIGRFATGDRRFLCLGGDRF